MLIDNNYLLTGNATEGESEENVLGIEGCMENFHNKLFASQLVLAFPTLSQWTETFVLQM